MAPAAIATRCSRENRRGVLRRRALGLALRSRVPPAAAARAAVAVDAAADRASSDRRLPNCAASCPVRCFSAAIPMAGARQPCWRPRIRDRRPACCCSPSRCTRRASPSSRGPSISPGCGCRRCSSTAPEIRSARSTSCAPRCRRSRRRQRSSSSTAPATICGAATSTARRR